MSDTTQDLIRRVKDRETIPDSGAAYSDTVLLEFLDQALKGFIVPAVEATLEEHFVVTQDKQMPTQPPYVGISPPNDVVNYIDIPGESTGLRLRDVYVIGNDGSFYNIPRLTPTQAAAQSFGTVWSPSVPLNNQQFVGGFYLQNNQVQIFPYGLASNKIVRITYQRAPADLCLTSDAGQIISIIGDVCTIDKVLPWFGTAQAPTTPTHINAINNDMPHDFIQDANVPTRVYASYAPLNDMTIVSYVGNVVTLPAGTGANVKVGDWLCPRGFSVFAQNIPRELLPVLVQKAAEMVLEAAGDRDGQQVAESTYRDMIKMAMLQLAPRVIGKPVKILPVNSPFKASRSTGHGRW